MKWIGIIGLLLIVPGCVDPVIPDELKAVLDDPASFSEVADVVHEGNLDGLPGCWGSYYETDDRIETYAEFVEFGDKWRHMTYWSLYGVAMVVVEEGTYTVEDESSINVVIGHVWISDPDTGELVPEVDLEYPETRDYHITLEGDRMTFFMFRVAPDADDADDAEGEETDQYEGTFWRFSECP